MGSAPEPIMADHHEALQLDLKKRGCVEVQPNGLLASTVDGEGTDLRPPDRAAGGM